MRKEFTDKELELYCVSTTITKSQLRKCIKIISDYFLNEDMTKKVLTQKITKVVGDCSVAKDIVILALSD